MEKEVKRGLVISGGILLSVATLGFIFRKRIYSFIANDMGVISEYARKIVWDATTEDTISELHPLMRIKAREFINKAEEKGYKLRIPLSGGFRSFKEQEELYAKGRTASGKKVTNARAGQSYHNYGLAIDVVEVEPLYGYDKNYPLERWKEIAKIGKSLGLKWGGDWSSFKDRPHFELKLASTDELLAIKNRGKVDSEGYVIV